MEKYFCALCHKEFVLEEDYGGCSICGWMHDPVQESDPDYHGGANNISLNEAKVERQKKNAYTGIVAGTNERVAAVG